MRKELGTCLLYCEVIRFIYLNTIRFFSKCTNLVMSAFFVLLKCEHILEIIITPFKFDSIYSVKKLIVSKFIWMVNISIKKC